MQSAKRGIIGGWMQDTVYSMSLQYAPVRKLFGRFHKLPYQTEHRGSLGAVLSNRDSRWGMDSGNEIYSVLEFLYSSLPLERAGGRANVKPKVEARISDILGDPGLVESRIYIYI